MKRARFIVYWNVQDVSAIPPWPLCAGHRDTVFCPLMTDEVCACRNPEHRLLVTKVEDGICALAAFGNCCDDPVAEVPCLDVCCLDREEL